MMSEVFAGSAAANDQCFDDINIFYNNWDYHASAQSLKSSSILKTVTLPSILTIAHAGPSTELIGLAIT
jgi:hypothetical protein